MQNSPPHTQLRGRNEGICTNALSTLILRTRGPWGLSATPTFCITEFPGGPGSWSLTSFYAFISLLLHEEYPCSFPKRLQPLGSHSQPFSASGKAVPCKAVPRKAVPCPGCVHALTREAPEAPRSGRRILPQAARHQHRSHRPPGPPHRGV